MAATARPVAPPASQLNRRVQLYDVPTETQDSYGQPSTTPPALIGTFWAAIRLLSWREKAAASQTTILATHMVTMRWLGSAIPSTTTNPHGLILPGMYLVVVTDDTRLDVLEADDVQRLHILWSLTCQYRSVI